MCFTQRLTMLFSECDVLPAAQKVSHGAADFLFAQDGSYFQLFFGYVFKRILYVFFVLMHLVGGPKGRHICAIVVKNAISRHLKKMSCSLAVFSLFLKLPVCFECIFEFV